MVIKQNYFGETSDGQVVNIYTLTSPSGIEVNILNLGCIIQSIKVPDKFNRFEDVTPGFDNVADYEKNPAYFGAVIGRVCNRISDGNLKIGDRVYQLATNQEKAHAHGGVHGFDKKIWTAKILDNGKDQKERLQLFYLSKDKEENYPGNLKVEVTYKLIPNDNDDSGFSLLFSYKATTDQPTAVNLTNHAYFNLAGHKAANIFDHSIKVNADYYLPTNKYSIPTGEICKVDGTPFDLRKAVMLTHELLSQLVEPSMSIITGFGYDHNFCIDDRHSREDLHSSLEETERCVHLACHLEHADSGRILEVWSNQRGLQLYTGNYLDKIQGKDGALYSKHSSLALESQSYPDAVNRDNFPNIILKPEETYMQFTCYRFSIKKN